MKLFLSWGQGCSELLHCKKINNSLSRHIKLQIIYLYVDELNTAHLFINFYFTHTIIGFRGKCLNFSNIITLFFGIDVQNHCAAANLRVYGTVSINILLALTGVLFLDCFVLTKVHIHQIYHAKIRQTLNLLNNKFSASASYVSLIYSISCVQYM